MAARTTSPDLLELTDRGLHCPAGGFFIDPWRPVERALVTHAHADHARPGSTAYLAAAPGLPLLRARLGAEAKVEGLGYGERLRIGEVTVSLHPAGHVLGSAQVRLELGGEVWVVSGDYGLSPNPTCAPFEPVSCHVFVTESTFGLPVYRWPEPERVLDEVRAWWAANRADGRPSVLYAYALGKAQRVLSGLGPDEGPVVAHGAVAAMVEAYREAGVALPPVRPVEGIDRGALAGALVLAPPSARRTPWMRRFPGAAEGFASGWMRLRGTRRRRAVDRGFVLSDHADWPALNRAIEATGAGRIAVTHGTLSVMVRWLSERGLDAWALATRFEGERADDHEGERG